MLNEKKNYQHIERHRFMSSSLRKLKLVKCEVYEKNFTGCELPETSEVHRFEVLYASVVFFFYTECLF